MAREYNSNQNITIDEIDHGLCVEQINEYLRLAVADIADLNKVPEKKRTVSISISIAPSKSRRVAEVTYKVDLKPSTHVERESTTIYFGKNEDGEFIGRPHDPQQPDMFEEEPLHSEFIDGKSSTNR